MLYLKDTQKWKQFTTNRKCSFLEYPLCYISKILKNESNSQPSCENSTSSIRCVISQRYSKMKAIHNIHILRINLSLVVLYLKDTQKWKQFTTHHCEKSLHQWLCYISKILKNESNSQQFLVWIAEHHRCVISQRYSKMKAIHNASYPISERSYVVLYLKDTQKWKQFTTRCSNSKISRRLCYISKILKNESNSQRKK